jgi:VIT1/CCC1 family predicted Fe2+/Mn2+ transporter
MSNAASLLQGQGTDGTHALVGRLTPDVLRRRVGQRRQMLAVQAVSYSLGALVLLIYSYSGTVPVIIPSTYFLCGLTLTGFFAVLSEAHVNDTGSRITISRSFKSPATSRSSSDSCWWPPRSDMRF